MLGDNYTVLTREMLGEVTKVKDMIEGLKNSSVDTIRLIENKQKSMGFIWFSPLVITRNVLA